MKKAIKKSFTVELTKDELTILHYVLSISDSGFGDPLKDTYELGDDEPKDPYKALDTVSTKLYKWDW